MGKITSWDQNIQMIPLPFLPPPPSPHPHPLILYFTEFFDPPVILRPSVYSGPKSKGLNLTFKIIFWKYIHHMIDLQIYLK